MKTTIVAVLLLLAMLPPASAQQKDSDWVTVEQNEWGFTVVMPVQPEVTVADQHTLAGQVKNHIFKASAGQHYLVADCSDLPHAAIKFAGPKTIYKHAVGSVLKENLGKEVSKSDVTLDGVVGVKLIFDVPPIKGHPEMTGEARSFLVGTRLWIFSAVVPAEGSEAVAERYFSSIKLEKP